MTTLEVFAPDWCTAPHVAQDSDPEACRFARDVEWLRARGVEVRLATLTRSAARFVEHDAVRFLMNVLGRDVLPVLLVDGVMRSHRTYPTREQLAGWTGVTLLEDAPDDPRAEPAVDLVSRPPRHRPARLVRTADALLGAHAS